MKKKTKSKGEKKEEKKKAIGRELSNLPPKVLAREEKPSTSYLSSYYLTI